MNVSIIGGAGHVGLPMGLVATAAGHNTLLTDKDRDKLDEITSGKVPFKEKGAGEILKTGLDEGRIKTSRDATDAAKTEVIIITIGTPIDEHNNPEMENLLGVISDLAPHLTEDQLLILRSTVYPGTTDYIRAELKQNGFDVGTDIYIAYAPERITQHNALEGMIQLPQLVGVYDDASYEKSTEFFGTFLEGNCYRLNPTEAEIGKLFTNMWRYITFSMANEFYYIADSFAEYHDVNVNRILDKTQKDYPRFNPPTPGANVGGPCLTKDGWFLIDNIPYNELVSTAFQINEGMPAQIIERLIQKRPDPEKVTILGMSFKANSDDTRNSVAFKMEKQLRLKGFRNIVRIEPNLEGFDDWEEIKDSDWVIMMTPHDEFKDLGKIHKLVDSPEAAYCDVWGFWESMKYESDNGYFLGRELTALIEEQRPGI